ncbi:MAG: Endodeoxyribonuclease RusA [Microgenomates group bacterium ADurb.Bin238]|jgi:Holliday junction resolvase RusA-like endonuclease|nr:MAG: Endodeoxyribonuclease RusA [Microgenomates group bacterium ADurb.Bin238]
MIKITGRPISKKNSRRLFVRGGRVINLPSSAYENFKEQALWQLKSYKEKYTGPVKVDLVFQCKGKLNPDGDNIQSSIWDILEDAGIIDDDKNITSWSGVKYHGFKDWVTLITITPTS